MPKCADFLVEIGTEELPPKALRSLENAFAENIRDGLVAAGLGSGSMNSFATPRRLAVLIKDLEIRQPPQKIEKRGPPIGVAFDAEGNPTRAGEAFANGCGVAITDLARLKTNKGEWLLFSAEAPGHFAGDLLPDIVAEALAALPVPKRMRWGSSDIEFVRPVHWALMLLGKEVVDCTQLGVRTGADTYGHRFHAPKPIRVRSPQDYPALLADRGRVIADFEERRNRIRQLTVTAATDLSGEAMIRDDVLEEVTALVEWPVPISGRFDPEFLRLPKEVIIATLQNHQRYFPVTDGNGKLLPHFIAMSNLESREPEQVRVGNERVIKPRLADAAFFWDQDKRVTLDSRREKLKQIVFQRELGSIYDKSVRVAKLATTLANTFDHDEIATQRAAALAKTDLLTQMVGEFPELQGRMGYHYAKHDGENEAVAMAIVEQYLPTHAGGPLPVTRTGQILAIADRLDTLAGIFAVGKRPSGNKDPFALRRAALAILRILIEDEIELDLCHYLLNAISAQPVKIPAADKLADELYVFIIDRMKAYCLDGQAPLLEKGNITPEIFESVRARRPGSPLDFYQRLVAVYRFMQLDAADSLAMANKRIANILKKAGDAAETDIDTGLFDADEEWRLHDTVAAIVPAHRNGLSHRDYAVVLEGLAALKGPVDAYFDTVLVMTDDAGKRRNRLNVLRHLRQLFLDVADLSCIPSH